VNWLAEEESIFLKSEYPFIAILLFPEKIDIFQAAFYCHSHGFSRLKPAKPINLQRKCATQR
jgi:hypothetical protein